MPEWRTRGVCRTPESSRNFGYVMGLTGLGLIIFYFFIVRKQFSENFSNLTTLDTISMLLPRRFAWCFYFDQWLNKQISFLSSAILGSMYNLAIRNISSKISSKVNIFKIKFQSIFCLGKTKMESGCDSLFCIGHSFLYCYLRIRYFKRIWR